MTKNILDIVSRHTAEGLTGRDRLLWILGDMMVAAENFFGAVNPKRLGHIQSTFERIEREVLDAEAKPDLYVIWSNQHRLWWAPNWCGYTPDLSKAGRYPREEALRISHDMRDGWRNIDKVPNEVPVRVADLPEAFR